MKQFIIFVILLTSVTLSQRNGSGTYFPYDVGNKWLYSAGSSGYFWRTITRDSTVEGKTFLFYDFLPYSLFPKYRVEPNIGVYKNQGDFYTLDQLFSYSFGQKWVVSNNSLVIAKVEGIYNETLFGKMTEVAVVSYNSAYNPNDTNALMLLYKVVYGKGIGELQYYDELGGFPQYNLVYCVVNGDTLGRLPVGIEKEDNKVPVNSFKVSQNFPNPFTDKTTITYSLVDAANVTLQIYNTLGEKVANFEEGYKPAGEHKARIYLPNIAKGVYLCRLQAGKEIKTIKMLVAGKAD